jgi:hypothetical protein
MPGRFELEDTSNGPQIVYKRYFVSNPEKYMEVHEDFYKQKLKDEEEIKNKRDKGNEKNSGTDTK